MPQRVANVRQLLLDILNIFVLTLLFLKRKVCSADCALCYGPNNSQCLACPQGKYLLTSTCLSELTCKAVQGKYPDFATMMCTGKIDSVIFCYFVTISGDILHFFLSVLKDCVGKCDDCLS